MNDPRVTMELAGRIAIVSLSHPPLNIYDLRMRDELIEAVTAVRDIPSVRVMVLRSEGTHFSAGADLSEFGSAGSVTDARRIRWERDPWGSLWDLPVATVVAMRGIALGSGLEMAMLCDIRIAATGSRLGLPETKLAMLPAAGGTQSLTWAIGPHASLPLIITGETIDASQALERGVVHEVVDDAESRAMEVATQLAAIDRDVLRAGRRLCHAAVDLTLHQGLDMEHRLAVGLANTQENHTS